MILHGRSIVAGEASPKQGIPFSVKSRLDGSELLPKFYNATDTEVDSAASMAEAAFEHYRKTSPEERAAFLEQIAIELDALGDELFERTAAETALPRPRLLSEMARTTGHFRMFAQLVREGSWVEARIDQGNPERQPLPKPDLRKMLFPLGPVAVFGASNFPYAYSVPGGDTASALAAGCPVVVKAHPSHPGVSEMVAEAVNQAVRFTGMPQGVFSMLHGNGPDVGMRLVQHPAIKAVGFTGSLRGGRALFNLAAARAEPIPVYAEMGSTNPVFVLPDALRTRGEAIAEGVVQSMSLGVGQFCTSPGVTFIMRSQHASGFAEDLARRAREVAGATMLNEQIAQSFIERGEKVRSVPGVHALTSRHDPNNTDSAPVAFETNAQTFLRERLLHEELFGPSNILVNCGSKEELETIARNLEGQLTATVHGTDEDLREHANLLEILRTRAGRLIINGFPTGVEVCSAMHHGGPYPAATDSRTTSVGPDAIRRFTRPVCFQNFPDELLPPELQARNPRGIWRLEDGELRREAL